MQIGSEELSDEVARISQLDTRPKSLRCVARPVCTYISSRGEMKMSLREITLNGMSAGVAEYRS